MYVAVDFMTVLASSLFFFSFKFKFVSKPRLHSDFLVVALLWSRRLVFGLAHASKAVIPRDETGRWAQRIGSIVSGTAAKSGTLTVTAYKTPGTNSSVPGSEYNRYSLVSFVIRSFPISPAP